MDKLSHFFANSRNISSNPFTPVKYSFRLIPAVRKAVEILFTSISSPSSSVPNNSPSEYSSLTSENLAITVFKAVPAVSADSRVVSMIWDKNAAVVSNSILALWAKDATLVIATEISWVSEAVIAANSE